MGEEEEEEHVLPSVVMFRLLRLSLGLCLHILSLIWIRDWIGLGVMIVLALVVRVI